MSYDIFVQNLPETARTIEDIPPDFKPALLGKRSRIVDKITEVPTVDFRNPSLGRLEGDGRSIEVSMGSREDCHGFTFHVRGDSGALDVAATILQHLNMRALGPLASGFFPPTVSTASFAGFRTYRDQLTKVKKP